MDMNHISLELSLGRGNPQPPEVPWSHIVPPAPFFCLTSTKFLFQQQKDLLDHFFGHVDYRLVHCLTQKVMSCAGKVFCTASVESGYIAEKLTQTFLCTGSRSIYGSRFDAREADMDDMLVILTKDASSEDLVRLAICARARGTYVVSITFAPNSCRLARETDLYLQLPIPPELSSSPVTATVIMMAFGDLVASSLMHGRKMTKEQMARNSATVRPGSF